MKANRKDKEEAAQHLEAPSQVVFYDFASKNNLSQLSLYLSNLRADLLWLHEKLDQEMKAESNEEKTDRKR